MQGACAVLYCRLWPVQLYNTFPHYLINGMACRGGGGLLNIEYVLIFPITSAWNISYSYKNLARYCHKCSNIIMQSTRFLVRSWWNLNIRDRFSKKYTNIKFRDIRSSGSRVVPCGRTDMTMLRSAFHNLAKAPRDLSIRAVYKNHRCLFWDPYKTNTCCTTKADYLYMK
jgi:hypothetical protein